MSKLSFLIHSGFEVNYAEMVRKQTTQTTPEKSARDGNYLMSSIFAHIYKRTSLDTLITD